MLVQLKVDECQLPLPFGLCAYVVQSQRWPDCVDEVARNYDFKAECERAMA